MENLQRLAVYDILVGNTQDAHRHGAGPEELIGELVQVRIEKVTSFTLEGVRV